jgi:hypothetical protein
MATVIYDPEFRQALTEILEEYDLPDLLQTLAEIYKQKSNASEEARKCYPRVQGWFEQVARLVDEHFAMHPEPTETDDE